MSDEKKDNTLDLHVVVFAGPNGSGKTSLIDEIKQTGLATIRGVYPLPAYFINPDQVAKDLPGDYPNQNARDEAAQRAAMRIRAEATASKLPFAFETVMSHPSRINEMLILKEQDYRLFLTFITTDNPEKNVERVTQRYETGTTTGHYVAPDKVRERYHRTLALLPRAAEIADAVYIYDNSADFEKPKLQAVIERDAQFSVSPDAKDWVIQRLVHPLQQRERELGQLIATLEKHGHQVGDADELNGTYQGAVLLKTSYYLAQLDDSTKQAVIHDRLMLDTGNKGVDNAPPTYSEKENLTIQYSQANAPRVERHGKRLDVNLDRRAD
ncbi:MULTISPECIES: zeta toxin family protein [unclassified Undibacterium]|uniref:zeta toxin family protein n=1 Tax=unclassified Undibacterium TaxID=2630295 RepID=UPI002AC9A78E|nr:MULTISPECIES: zeta toxin family protein [unclassified Undibacterium]MEB0138227.1 zeta toxin family protein [Undibacterium sp. CCC2.1]MEB0171612.1 zeta toxin family protein [Undibacterium sp. CCC1.1]MEB0175468.1 zeta toxin family protein [Undibacterium sp. CCC3.4]MEB0214812.1 zeta toxin family protein [Undibacterium sp. 5I2]WPX45299.1 zeta toxin family protein [Undibacterium sp. CCC3.4]